MFLAATLYLLGSVYCLINMRHESGASWPIVLLSIAWPLCVLGMIWGEIIGGDDDEGATP